ncbi:MAG: hypothetical protein WBL77_18080, partial [Pseudolabrys sp.]
PHVDGRRPYFAAGVASWALTKRTTTSTALLGGAGLPAPRLQPLAAGGKVFDFIGIRCGIRMCRRFD